MESLPEVRKPSAPQSPYSKNFSISATKSWLVSGWNDFITDPIPSIAFGLVLTLISWGVISILYFTNLLYLGLPALSGFLIVGPFFAMGLYEKSRKNSKGEAFSFTDMVRFRPRSSTQIAFAGLMLGLLVLFWLRSADLLYALFFGIKPFPGAMDAFINVFTTPTGWLLLITGTLVGGMFASFAFAISVFAIPMLSMTKTDALTAMGISFSMTVKNLPVMVVWGGIVTVGLVMSVLSGLILLVFIFPILGHATWHVYSAFMDVAE